MRRAALIFALVAALFGADGAPARAEQIRATVVAADVVAAPALEEAPAPAPRSTGRVSSAPRAAARRPSAATPKRSARLFLLHRSLLR
jgi:hypothetical protein